MMLSTLTLKIDKVWCVWFRWYLSLTALISFWKLRISGLISVCFFLSFSSAASFDRLVTHPSCLSFCSFCDAVTFMRFAVDYRRLSNLDGEICNRKRTVLITHFTLIDQYIGKSKQGKWLSLSLSRYQIIVNPQHSSAALHCWRCCFLLWFVHPLLGFGMRKEITR